MRIQTLLNHSSKDDFGSSYGVHRDARNSVGSLDYAQQRPSLQLHGRQLSDSIYHHRSSSPRSSGETWLEGGMKGGPSFHQMGSGYSLTSSTSQQSARYHRERTSFSSRSSHSGSSSLPSSTATTAPFRDAPAYNEYDHEQTAQPRHLLLHAESSKPQHPGFHPPTLLPPLSIYPSDSMNYSPSSTVVDGRSTSFSMASSTYHGSDGYPHAISPYPAYYARLPASKSSYDALNSGNNPLMRFADAVMEDANRERRLDPGGRHTREIPSPKSGDHRLNIEYVATDSDIIPSV